MILAAVRPHSFIDIITNSSSELFVFNSDKTLDFIESMLRTMLENYNLANSVDYKYENCFKDVVKLDETNIREHISGLLGWEIRLDIPAEAGLDDYVRYDDFKDFKDYQLFMTKEKEWIDNNIERLTPYLKGITLIRSANDNSIPYELFETIQSAFGGRRYHLG